MSEKEAKKMFDEIYSQYFAYIGKYCGYCLQSYPDYADDCVQETFEVLYKRIKDGTFTPTYTKAFLMKTAQNFIKIKFTEIKKSHENTVSLEQDIPEEVYEPDLLENVSEEEILKRRDVIIASLSPKERKLLSESGKKAKELAKEYSVSENAIRQRRWVLSEKVKIIAAKVSNGGESDD